MRYSKVLAEQAQIACTSLTECCSKTSTAGAWNKLLYMYLYRPA